MNKKKHKNHLPKIQKTLYPIRSVVIALTFYLKKINLQNNP